MASQTTYTCDAYDNEGLLTTTNQLVVTRNAPPNQPPTATLSATNTSGANGTSSTLTCSATDFDGTIVRYIFEKLVNGVWTTVQDGTSNTFTTTPGDNSATTYRCVVTDSGGAQTASNSVTLARATAPPPPNQPPTAELTGTNPAAINGTDTLLNCQANDVDGTVVSYEFFISTDGGNSWSSLGAASSTKSKTTVPPDNTTSRYRCQVIDDDGAATYSNVFVATRAATPPPPPNQPPKATLTGTNPSGFNGTQSQLTCAAADADGSIVNYRFERFNPGIGWELVQSGPSNTCTVTPGNNASNDYRCVVTDNGGEVAISNTFSITRQAAPAAPNQPPVAALSGTELVATNGTQTTLTCTANDPVATGGGAGAVVRYVFRRNGVVIYDGPNSVVQDQPTYG